MIRVGIVGYGYWGKNLLRNFVGLETCQVKWICDVDRTRLTAVTRHHPSIQVTDRYNDLLKDSDLDAVLVATPINTHAPLARQAFEAAGGGISHFFLTLGTYDAVAIITAPDDEAYARTMLQVASAGAISSTTLKALTENQYRSVISGMP